MKLPLANQAVIPRRTVPRCEQQTQRVWPPALQISAQVFYQFGRDRETAIALPRFHRLDLASPNVLANLNHGILEVEIGDTESANLAAPYAGLCQDRIERPVRSAGSANDALSVGQRKGKGLDQPSFGQNQTIKRIVGHISPRPSTVPHHAERGHEVADRLGIAVATGNKRLQSLAVQILERT